MDMTLLEKIIIDSKRKYGSVFSTVIGDQVYIWRLLTRGEYEIILKSAVNDNFLKEELVCQVATIFPEVNFTMYDAGVASALAPQILEESGFGSVIKTYRYLATTRMDILENFSSQAEIVIASAFPQYSFEDMQKWNIEKLLDMVARAEWKLNVLDGKDFAFKVDEESSENEEVEELTQEEMIAREKEKVKEFETKIIENGGDPILRLGNYYKSKVEKPYIDFPFIMGDNWDREDVLDAIRQQQKRRSNN